MPSHREKFRHNKIFKLYDKFREILTLLSELFYMRAQTDTSVIRAISLGVTPFFVNSLLELQLSALPLVTEVFTVLYMLCFRGVARRTEGALEEYFTPPLPP